MLILEYKLIVSCPQVTAIGEAIKVVQFIRNKAIRLWMDTDAKPYDLNRYCAVLAKEYPFVTVLNSQARQAAAERAAYAISRFLKPNVKGKRHKKPKFHLAKSIHDAAWSQFAFWLLYYGKVFGKPVVKVPPQYTSQDCSACGKRVKKALSERTHVCSCGCVLDRDENAARNILRLALAILAFLNQTYLGAPGNVEGLPSETPGEKLPKAIWVTTLTNMQRNPNRVAISPLLPALVSGKFM